jgi:hypothetical protein
MPIQKIHAVEYEFSKFLLCVLFKLLGQTHKIFFNLGLASKSEQSVLMNSLQLIFSHVFMDLKLQNEQAKKRRLMVIKKLRRPGTICTVNSYIRLCEPKGVRNKAKCTKTLHLHIILYYIILYYINFIKILSISAVTADVSVLGGIFLHMI